MRSGIDANGDGVVSESEARSTTYVCNGVAGPSGTPGSTGSPSLNKVTAEAAGANCTLGGYRLDTGLDANANNTLDATEITSTQYLCTPPAATAGLLLLSKTYIGASDASCPGGYSRIAYGADTNGDGMLSTAEQTSDFLACNVLPRLTSAAVLTVSDCTAMPIVLPITTVDLDGQVTQVDVRLLGSGSPLVFSTTATGQVQLTAGAHVARADIEVTLTDNNGAKTTTTVRLLFTGTGCVPLETFYGVKPETCRAIEIEPLVGDDRSGPVLTQRAAYYNGDYGLMRVGLDLNGGTPLTAAEVDGLMGDSVRGRLLSLWSSQWGATTADGGAGPGITGLLDRGAGARFSARQSPEGLDELVVLDETTFAPTAHLALSQPFAPSAQTDEFSVTLADAGVMIFTNDQTLLAAYDGQALIGRFGSNGTENAVLYQLINTTTGALTLERGLVFAQGDTTADSYRWNTQEDDYQHYALTTRGTQYVVTFLNGQGWVDLELAAGAPILRTASFARDCEVQNLALTSDRSTAIFHAEYACFGFNYSELLLRCDTLTSDNSDGGVNDLGSNGGG